MLVAGFLVPTSDDLQSLVLFGILSGSGVFFAPFDWTILAQDNATTRSTRPIGYFGEDPNWKLSSNREKQKCIARSSWAVVKPMLGKMGVACGRKLFPHPGEHSFYHRLARPLDVLLFLLITSAFEVWIFYELPYYLQYVTTIIFLVRRRKQGLH